MSEEVDDFKRLTEIGAAAATPTSLLDSQRIAVIQALLYHIDTKLGRLVELAVAREERAEIHMGYVKESIEMARAAEEERKKAMQRMEEFQQTMRMLVLPPGVSGN